MPHIRVRKFRLDWTPLGVKHHIGREGGRGIKLELKHDFREGRGVKMVQEDLKHNII